jgi:phosphomethylpyrimidine synthase
MTKKADYKVSESTLAAAARQEPVDERWIAEGVKNGTIVVLENSRRRGRVHPVAVGTGLKTKVNANFGTSRDVSCLEDEQRKMKAAVDAGTDAVMDLSTGEDMEEMLRMVLDECPVPVGTVPLYPLATEIISKGTPLKKMADEAFIEVVAKHCELGVDFVTVHCGVTLEAVRYLNEQGRVTGIVSRGGSFLNRWMQATGRENPLYTYYDEILKIAGKYNVTLSLGDGLRPGSIADATDRAQTSELVVLGELVDRARAAGVQAMVEGPGHVPLNQVEMNIRMQKEICKGAPFYVLGPLVTDIAPGYDHITSAIGGAVAGAAGADFLCYVTPAEHLRLPTVEDVHTGVIATRIAAHAADIAKGIPGAAEWDRRMSTARKALDWDKMLSLAIDSPLARKIRQSSRPQDKNLCTMCSELCAMK